METISWGGKPRPSRTAQRFTISSPKRIQIRWLACRFPAGGVKYINGISGNTLVGTYIQASRYHPTLGFVYIIPEPGSLVLAARRRRRLCPVCSPDQEPRFYRFS